MSHLQKTPVGLARRILGFDEETSTVSNELLLDGKTPPTAGFPIETIREGKELNGSRPTSSTNIPSNARKAPPKSVPDPSFKPDTTSQVNPKSMKPTETSGTARLTISKPKTAQKPGKAGKNAVNSEVQSLAQKIKPPSAAQKATSAAAASKSKQAALPVPKPLVQMTQSWAQRLQNASKHEQPVQQKPKLFKAEPPKPPKKTPHVRSQTAPLAVSATLQPSSDQEEGWETVRGRTRSRTSPAHTIPALTRASTVIYVSRQEAKQASKTSNRQSLRRIGLLKSSTAQSLPSLCDRIPDPPKPVETAPTPEPAEKPDKTIASDSHELSPSTVAANISTDEEKDEPDEALESAEEEAEMARREQALTMEEENLQREIRETERSDTEGDESWEEPFTVTPVLLRFFFPCLFLSWFIYKGLHSGGSSRRSATAKCCRERFARGEVPASVAKLFVGGPDGAARSAGRSGRHRWSSSAGPRPSGPRETELTFAPTLGRAVRSVHAARGETAQSPRAPSGSP